MVGWIVPSVTQPIQPNPSDDWEAPKFPREQDIQHFVNTLHTKLSPVYLLHFQLRALGVISQRKASVVQLPAPLPLSSHSFPPKC